MKILILGIGNILFGDEGIGVHLANYINEKYEFSNHDVDIVDGGTLAQRLIPIIVEYDKVFIFDTVDVDDANIGEVYFFDFLEVPDCVNWEGSAHEVEMLQTLEMIRMMGDLPETKIIGVVPYVIGEDTTFSITKEVQEAAKLMEKVLITELKKLGVEVKIKNEDVKLTDVAKLSYKLGVDEFALKGLESGN